MRVAPRPGKPRRTGLTIVADRGMGTRRLADLLECAGDYIDYAKFAMGVYRLLDEDLLARKIGLYRERGISVFFAGEISELAVLQGVARPFFRTIKALGADAVEVSSAQIAMPVSEKVALIRAAIEEGLDVVAECGQKGRDEWASSPRYVSRQVGAYLDAGARLVLVQAEGVNEGVARIDDRLIFDLVADFGLERLVFQAKESRLLEWFLVNFGNQVNLDVDDHQVLELESLRRGIRKRGIFGMMGGL